jgi:hypothetical protein
VADAEQENPKKPAKIEQIRKFELVRFGSRRSEFRHRKGIVRELATLIRVPMREWEYWKQIRALQRLALRRL